MTSESMWGGNMTPNTSMAGSDAVDEFLSAVWAKRRGDATFKHTLVTFLRWRSVCVRLASCVSCQP